MPDENGNETSEDFSSFLDWNNSPGEGEEVLGEDPNASPSPSPAPATVPPVAQDPAPAPSPAPSPAPAPVMPSPVEAIRQEQMVKENEQYQRENLIHQINGMAQQEKDKLVAAGWTAEDAHQQASNMAQNTLSKYESQMAVAYGQEQARQNVARQLATETGMSYDTLLSYPNEASMKAASTQYKEWQGQLEAARSAAPAAPKPAPVHDLDSHDGGAGSSDQSLRYGYAMGRITLSNAELSRLGIGT